MRKRSLFVCDSCGQIPCECRADQPHSPGPGVEQVLSSFDTQDYDPRDRGILRDEDNNDADMEADVLLRRFGLALT